MLTTFKKSRIKIVVAIMSILMCLFLGTLAVIYTSSQLVSILIDNAIRHGQRGKEVNVTMTESRGMAVLKVVNDGAPIPPDKAEHLFERFYRADEARNGEDKHYGLGLSIAKAIVTAHHGKIDVSCYDGKVSFTARLPKMQAKATPQT